MKQYILTAVIILVLGFTGCSQGASPLLPEEQHVTGDPILSGEANDISHGLWGLWQFMCDPSAGTVEFVEMRDAGLHMNALKFLEPPAGLYLSLESPPEFTGNVLDIDIGLRHPFLGLIQFTGFDVCGVFISNGSVDGFSDPDLVMKGEGDTRLLNADGYTRWWNPVEFPYNADAPIFGYIDGLMGMPDDVADYNATLNGYRYFADGLDPDEPFWNVDVPSRGMFAAGQKNVRHYTIGLDGGFVFNYAVDANWKSTGLPPSQIEVPDSFSPEANRPEAWGLSVVEVENTLYFEESTGIGSGELSLMLDVYDWYYADENTVYGESLSGISLTLATGPTGGGSNFSTYEIDLQGDSLTQNGEIDILFTVESTEESYGGILPGKTVCNYFKYTAYVKGEAPEPPSGEFYIMSDKSAWSYEATQADNPMWLRNLALKATGPAAENDIVLWYYGHGAWMVPTHNQNEIFGWYAADGFTPIKDDMEPIDPTGCRMITMCCPGRWEVNLFSNDEIAALKQFISDGGILAIQAEVDDSDCWSTQETFDHLIQSLGSGVSWLSNYGHPGGNVWTTTNFDHDHKLFDNVTLIKWNLPSQLEVSKPTDIIIAWGDDGEAMMVASQVE